MRKTNLLTSLFLCLAYFSFAQTGDIDRSQYALLWEISGNNLTEPSYVFGTFHVRDKVIFDFPDSFFLKLQACDAFANEIHFDSAMTKEFEYEMQDSTLQKAFLEKLDEAEEKKKDKKQKRKTHLRL